MKNDKLLSLPPVSEMMRDADLNPKKQLGQNFLFDLNLTRKIAGSVPNINGANVIEVGPGPGGLTRALLECGAGHVIAIEKDLTTAPILEKIKNASGGRLEVIFDDALRALPKLKMDSGFHICANLPYNVGTHLLTEWLENANGILSMTLMFQREVAQRIVAVPGDAEYGRLAVLTALTADAKILFNVPRTAFFPMPKVTSSVVQIIPKKNNIDIARVSALTAKLFGQRRKMIRGILPGINWEKFGLIGTERAENLSPKKFVELAREIVV
ncbi:MAG: 16S rRNA (adenine(1518)-N(6)/adenine(1519)-N(6))-dimethyltransferase RsmA [Rickettsiales bacterium]|jgi:16S rRNA (adenine1518-N6/adenine1519-N6)-dimethyltransferase|nr:16S rRNA (adenine(1518)-N(6)/adenine(1519)-N(6))-dimethyltransferase RsmA [Rickettsiales bacterium]